VKIADSDRIVVCICGSCIDADVSYNSNSEKGSDVLGILWSFATFQASPSSHRKDSIPSPVPFALTTIPQKNIAVSIETKNAQKKRLSTRGLFEAGSKTARKAKQLEPAVPNSDRPGRN
jgi:hypothetical protein